MRAHQSCDAKNMQELDQAECLRYSGYLDQGYHVADQLSCDSIAAPKPQQLPASNKTRWSPPSGERSTPTQVNGVSMPSSPRGPSSPVSLHSSQCDTGASSPILSCTFFAITEVTIHQESKKVQRSAPPRMMPEMKMPEIATSGKQPQDTAADDALLHALHHTHTEATRLFLMATRQGATDAQIADALRQGVLHITDPGTRCDNLEKENSIKKLMAEIDSVRQDLVLKDKQIKVLVDQHDDLLEALTVAQRQSIDALLARDEAVNAKQDALHARDRIEMELSSCLQVLIELQSSGHANELIDEENALHKQVTCILGPKLDGHDVAVAALKKRHNTLKAEIQRLPLLSGRTQPPCTPPGCSAPDPIRSADQEGLRNNIE